MKSPSFEASLAEGRQFQAACADWLRRKYGVLVHDLRGLGDNEGPKLIGINRKFVTPDLLVAVGGKTWWVECKKKEKADWHWKTQTYVTGIDRWHYAQYRHVKRETGFPVYLLFLHELEREIRGEELSWLEANVHHFDHGQRMHPSGMVFWEYAALRVYGSLDELDLPEEVMADGAA